MPDGDPREMDQARVKAAQAGDRDAFDSLVESYKDIVYAVAYRFARDPDLALDLAQEVFIRAYRGIKSFKGRSRFSTWLYRIATNTCIDYTRRRARSVDSRVVPEEVAEYAGSEPIASRGPDGPDDRVLSASSASRYRRRSMPCPSITRPSSFSMRSRGCRTRT